MENTTTIFLNSTNDTANYSRNGSDRSSFFKALFVPCIIAGLSINLFLCISIVRTRKMRQNPFYRCVLNLFILQLLECVFTYPMELNIQLHARWQYSLEFCKAFLAISFTNGPAIIVATLCVLLERISNKLEALKPSMNNCTRRFSFILLFVPWLFYVTSAAIVAMESVEDEVVPGFCFHFVYNPKEPMWVIQLFVLIPSSGLVTAIFVLLVTYSYRNQPGFTQQINRDTNAADDLKCALIPVMVAQLILCMAVPIEYLYTSIYTCYVQHCCSEEPELTVTGLITVYALTTVMTVLNPFLWLLLPDLRQHIKDLYYGILGKIQFRQRNINLTVAYQRDALED